jgi:gliding motility-associated-like protein
VCVDSTTIDVTISHPLLANFTVDNDLICQGGVVTFTDASTATPPSSPYWDFGNGDVNSSGAATVSATYLYAGNYTVMMIISDFIGCKDTAYKQIRVDSLTDLQIAIKDDVICAGDEIHVDLGYADTGSTGITWDFADGIIKTEYDHDMEHAFENPGTYNIHIIATGRVCPDVDSMKTIVVEPNPQINLGVDTFLCPGSENLVLQDLINAGNPAASWKWMLADVIQDVNSFNMSVTQPGEYSAKVTIGGCSASDSISIVKSCYLDVPNAFSPDGDNNNDYFLPRQLISRGVATFKMQVFNRWGQEIFSTTNIDGRGWDGRFNGEPQPQGVYIYLIDVSFNNGVKEKKQGNVTLLR